MPKDAPYPSEITLNGIRYEIVRFDHSAFDSEDDTCDGKLEMTRLEIHVRDDAKPQPFWLVLGHEVCHEWLEWSGLGQILEKDQTEAVCDAVGAGLIRLLTQNPGLQDRIREAFER